MSALLEECDEKLICSEPPSCLQKNCFHSTTSEIVLPISNLILQLYSVCRSPSFGRSANWVHLATETMRSWKWNPELRKSVRHRSITARSAGVSNRPSS